MNVFLKTEDEIEVKYIACPLVGQVCGIMTRHTSLDL
jgi:hypothetical protein